MLTNQMRIHHFKCFCDMGANVAYLCIFEILSTIYIEVEEKAVGSAVLGVICHKT